MELTTKITGNQKVAGFVNIYNSNNQKIEEKLDEIQKKLNNLTELCSNMVNITNIKDIITNQVNVVLSKYEEKSLTIGDVKDITNEIIDNLNIQSLENNVNTLNTYMSDSQIDIDNLKTSLQQVQNQLGKSDVV